MIEQALTFAIGFLAAALAGVAATPLLSRRAMRLAVQRARLTAPVTEKQAAADLDALRAQHAVERARIERRLALAEEASTGLRAAVGRQASEIIRLRSDIADLDRQLYDQRAEAERLALHARDLRATVDATQFALDDAFVQRDRASMAQEAAEARAAESDAESSRNRARSAVLTARAEYLEGRMEDLTHAVKAARDKAETLAASLEAERGRAAALDARLGAATGESRSLADRLSKAEAERGELAGRLAGLETRLRLSERAREETLVENARQLAALADLKSALAAASGKAGGRDARPTAAAAEAHAPESASSLGVETLAAAHAATEGSPKSARADRGALQGENQALRMRIAAADASSREADAELRASIARLGREVARLFSAQKAPDGRELSGADAGAPGGRGALGALAASDGETLEFADGVRRRAAGRSRSPER